MTMVAAIKGGDFMESKRVSISQKRQITIPQKFFTVLGFDKEAECFLRGDELIIRPTKINSSGEFAEQILADLIKSGYSGDELLSMFKIKQKEIRPAVESMLYEASRVSEGRGKYYTYDDVFNTGEDE